ncbi:putative MFS-type transporter [Pseudomonas chlororaphis]|uniref:MFS transporter n=1 Tax=Pseudomonas chlororaphis TaxID=587753 RepID=UPI000F7209B4|nr:MFS transporter [Pseudomonas chlororaphis]AZD06178.1 putative MFS-type transporter [Pseudomonas chlororaphis]
MKAMHRQVGVLASAQALFQTVSVLVMTVGGLAGAQLTERADLATVPIASMFLGTAVGMFPASALMAKAGRRAGFMLGAALGVLGGLVAALGIWLTSLPLLALGTFFVGTYQAFAQFYRFAASEVADDVFRPKAISLVLAGGIVAALLGPTLARFGGDLLTSAYLGSFLLLSVVAGLGFGVLTFLQMPKTETTQIANDKGRPWRQIVTQPTYLVALFGAVTGYGIMILAMTATPLAMIHHHHSLAAAATVIQLHVLGMFLPSFFTGPLISRIGALWVMLLGLVLLALHVLTTFTGTGFNSFAGALVLLGVGWNFLFIGGTTLLTTTYSPAEKSRAQATNDLVIFAVGLSCSFGAGGLLNILGWETLNALLLPWLALAALAIIWLLVRSKRGTYNGAPQSAR